MTWPWPGRLRMKETAPCSGRSVGCWVCHREPWASPRSTWSPWVGYFWPYCFPEKSRSHWLASSSFEKEWKKTFFCWWWGGVLFVHSQEISEGLHRHSMISAKEKLQDNPSIHIEGEEGRPFVHGCHAPAVTKVSKVNHGVHPSVRPYCALITQHLMLWGPGGLATLPSCYLEPRPWLNVTFSESHVHHAVSTFMFSSDLYV